MAKAGVQPHLAEPADTAALRGPKRRAKSDRADARHLRELPDVGMLPECYIPPDRVLEWRATLELYSDLRIEHAGWVQHIHAVCFHQGATAVGPAGVVRGSRERLAHIIADQLSPIGRLQVNTALAVMDALDEHLLRVHHGRRRSWTGRARRSRRDRRSIIRRLGGSACLADGYGPPAGGGQ
jgi:transposase